MSGVLDIRLCGQRCGRNSVVLVGFDFGGFHLQVFQIDEGKFKGELLGHVTFFFITGLIIEVGANGDVLSMPIAEAGFDGDAVFKDGDVFACEFLFYRGWINDVVELNVFDAVNG